MKSQFRSLATLTAVLVAATIAGIAGSGQGAAGGRGNRGGAPASPQDLVLRRANGITNATGHDPSTIIKGKDEYYPVYTGNNVPSWHSTDLINWTAGGNALAATPAW